jgi:hypothetical protein
MFSRRGFVRSSASLLGSLLARGWSAEPTAPDSLKVTLVQQFPNARLVSVSPDGTHLCLEDWKISGYPLRVVEVATWRTIYTGAFHIRALAAGFFADGEALFLDFPGGKGQLAHRQIVVDIRTRERTEQMRQLDPFEYFEQTSPMDDRTLLVAHYRQRPNQPSYLQWLARVKFPGYAELARVELHSEANDPTSRADIGISADHKLLFHFFDSAIVCRRSEDLTVLWTHPIEKGLAAFPTISAHGDYVATGIARSTSDGQVFHYTYLYVSVYDRKTGVEIARLPISGKEGIAISPDGKLLAVVVRESGENGEVVPTVHIYDLPSGVSVATVVHDRIPKGRRQFLEAGCGVAFTSDGKYLITSGMVTKVWRIGE